MQSWASLGEKGPQELLLPNSRAKAKSALEADLFVQCWRVMVDRDRYYFISEIGSPGQFYGKDVADFIYKLCSL